MSPTVPFRRRSAWLLGGIAALALAAAGSRLRGERRGQARATACDAARRDLPRAVGETAPAPSATAPTHAGPREARPHAAAGAPVRAAPAAAPAPPGEDPLVAGNVDLATRALELAVLRQADAATAASERDYEVARRAQEARRIEAGVWAPPTDGEAAGE
jgi:hypothetical protein